MEGGFNPSQVRFKPIPYEIQMLKQNLFQSLTGAIQTDVVVMVKKCIIASFNPSQVRFKQVIYYDQGTN